MTAVPMIPGSVSSGDLLELFADVSNIAGVRTLRVGDRGKAVRLALPGTAAALWELPEATMNTLLATPRRPAVADHGPLAYVPDESYVLYESEWAGIGSAAGSLEGVRFELTRLAMGGTFSLFDVVAVIDGWRWKVDRAVKRRAVLTAGRYLLTGPHDERTMRQTRCVIRSRVVNQVEQLCTTADVHWSAVRPVLEDGRYLVHCGDTAGWVRTHRITGHRSELPVGDMRRTAPQGRSGHEPKPDPAPRGKVRKAVTDAEH